MFLLNPPNVRALDVFTALPERFRRKEEHTVWADANQGGRCIDSFLEGPVFDAAGNLYVTDIPYGRVFRIDRAGHWDLVGEWDGEPNGMKFLSDTELLVTDYKKRLMVLDLREGRVRPFLARRNTERFKGVNDLVFDAQGNLYFTDQGQTGLHDPSGRVYRLGREGRLDLLLDNVPSPNGIVLSLDGKFLFVAATRGNCVWRMPLQADGSVAKAGQFFTSYGPSGPDGLAMNEAGQLLVANPGLAYLWVLNRLAEPVEILRGPAGHSLTNLAFGPGTVNGVLQARQGVYATDSTAGHILFADMETPGMCLLPTPGSPFL